MTLSELAQHLTREELAAFDMWPDPCSMQEPMGDEVEAMDEAV